MTRRVNLHGYLEAMVPMLLIWGVMVHEYGHLLALRVMGFTGEIRSTGLNLVHLTGDATATQVALWRFSGGLLQAIYGASHMMRQSDNETWLSGFTVMCQGFIYAFFETLNVPTLGAVFSITITALLIILLQVERRISFD